jgi:hypothetical protein
MVVVLIWWPPFEKKNVLLQLQSWVRGGGEHMVVERCLIDFDAVFPRYVTITGELLLKS